MKGQQNKWAKEWTNERTKLCNKESA